MTTIKKAAGKKSNPDVKTKNRTATKKTIPVKKKEPVILTDDHIDIVLFDKQYNAKIPIQKIKAGMIGMDELAEICPQGKQPRVIRDHPHEAPPLNTSNYITELLVTLSLQNLRITWLNGTVENLLCSPNPSLTPVGNDLVGNKCGPKHTNYAKDGMAWFTALKSRGMAYGFHNSQRVGPGIVSHGCIRVLCADAKRINQHSWSGKTKIKIKR